MFHPADSSTLLVPSLVPCISDETQPGPVERLVTATCAALRRRQQQIDDGTYFVHDLHVCRDLSLSLALAGLAGEGLTPALRTRGRFTAAQVGVIAQVYRALMAEQRRGKPGLAPPSLSDLRLPAGNSGGAAERRINARGAASPASTRPGLRAGVRRLAACPPPLPGAGTRRRAPVMSVPVAARAVLDDFTASGSWQALPPLGWRPPTWSSLMASATAAMVATTVLVRAAFTFVS